jgi:hypothetical protein
MFGWLRWRVVSPVLALVMALAPVVCVAHCHIGARVRFDPHFLHSHFSSGAASAQTPSTPAPLADMQLTYEQVTVAALPAPAAQTDAPARAEARPHIPPILRRMALSPEEPPPRNYELRITNF